ncbi:hypothetical protein [Streptomyces sp. NPDC005955]
MVNLLMTRETAVIATENRKIVIELSTRWLSEDAPKWLVRLLA